MHLHSYHSSTLDPALRLLHVVAHAANAFPAACTGYGPDMCNCSLRLTSG